MNRTRLADLDEPVKQTSPTHVLFTLPSYPEVQGNVTSQVPHPLSAWARRLSLFRMGYPYPLILLGLCLLCTAPFAVAVRMTHLTSKRQENLNHLATRSTLRIPRQERQDLVELQFFKRQWQQLPLGQHIYCVVPLSQEWPVNTD